MALRASILMLLSALLLTGAVRAQEVPTYTVKRGDTLYSIARAHSLSVEALRRMNDLDGTIIRVGQVLVVGRPAPSEAPPADTTAPSVDTDTAPVDTGRAGGAGASGARRDTIRAAAGPDGAPVDSLRGAPPVGDPAARSTPGVHVVQPGETLYGLAVRYGVSPDTLRALNAPVPTFLAPGRRLRLPRSRTIVTHRVAAGETLYDVAARYGVSVRVLQEANDLGGAEAGAGALLRIPGYPPPPPAPVSMLPPPDTSGRLHVYPDAFAGRLMAGGVPYDPQAFTASHPTLPFGTVVLLTNPVQGRHAFAVIRDRGPLEEGYLMDVSTAIARRLRLGADAEPHIDVRVVNGGMEK